jgi:hypothetical protein
MRKTFVAIIAAGAVGAVWADAATNQEQFRDQPEAHAYLSFNFGGRDNRHTTDAPFHYGLRMDHDSRLRAAAGAPLPPLLQVDRNNRGETLALANGVPFAARNLRLNQDSGGGTSSGGNDSGWTFFDWSLLAVGLGGAGYLIYNATKGKDSPNGTPAGNTTGSSNGVVTGLVNTVTGVVTGVVNTVTGVVNSVTGYSGPRSVQGVLPFDPVDRSDPTYQKWLDGGHGQMGDLGG